MSDDDLSRKQRRFLARKQQILQAAARVFADSGFHRATISDIADAADLAVGTIYIYFKSKEDILMGIFDQLTERELRRPVAEESLNYPYREVFEWGLRERIKRLDDESFMMHLAVLPEVLSDPELRQLYYQRFIEPSIRVGEEHVRARIELGHIEPLEDVPMVVRIMHSTWLGMSMLMLMGDEELREAWKDPDRVAQAVIAFFFDPVKLNPDADVKSVLRSSPDPAARPDSISSEDPPNDNGH